MVRKLIFCLLFLLLGGCQSFKSKTIPRSAFQGRLDSVKKYIEAGGEIELEDEFGFSLLQRSVMGGSLEITTFLVDRGADVNRANNFGMTPLTLACDEGNREMAALLLKRGADPNLIPQTEHVVDVFLPLHAAVNVGDMKLVDLLIKSGARVDLPAGGRGLFSGWSPLMLSIPGEADECLSVLLSNGADPNFRVTAKYGPMTPFSLAAASGRSDLLDQLGSSAAAEDPILVQSSLLRFHISTGQIAKARENVAAGADIRLKGFLGKPLLYLAAATGQAGSVRYLLGLDCDPNETNALGETPLMAASQIGAVGVVRILLEAGADKKLKNGSGLTAFDMARKKGYLGIVELLQTE